LTCLTSKILKIESELAYTKSNIYAKGSRAVLNGANLLGLRLVRSHFQNRLLKQWLGAPRRKSRQMKMANNNFVFDIG